MTDQGYRFCPRCGTALVAGLPFCPRCGLDTTGAGDATQRIDAESRPVDADSRTFDMDPFPPPMSPPTPATPNVADAVPRGPSPGKRARSTPLILGALIVVAGLFVFGLLMRPPAATGPGSGPLGGPAGSGSTAGPGTSQAGPTAPIVGISIESPQDGAAVATKEVTVIGIAPPGLSITRDISFGLDQHATVDGTGHWAINVSLEQGDNVLVFRIGDDRSTERKLRVTYAPPPAN
jgi:hypothetical protein